MQSEKEIVDLFCRLASLDAPSRSERLVADAVTAYLNELGITVEEDDTAARIGGNSGNLTARIPGSVPGPAILFCAHMDTVEPCHDKKIIITDDRVIRSDGTTILGADDVAALTGILANIKDLMKTGIPHRDIELFFTVAEETHLLGSRQVDLSGFKAACAYVIDANRAPGIGVTGAPGHISFEVDITGQSAHAGINPEEGVSAITVAATAIARMKLGRVDAITTANIGRIEGGTVTNIVADSCRLTTECRSLEWSRLEAQAQHMRECLESAAAEAGAQVAITETINYYPYDVQPDGLAMKQFLAACERLGIKPELVKLGGGSDMNVLARGGIPGMVLSCGMQRMHSCQEFITIDDLMMTVDLIRQLMTLPVPV